MNRFIQTYFDNKLPDNYYDYIDYPVLPLMVALEPLLSNIDQLYPQIKLAERYCCQDPDHKLTNDESAALYLYTQNYNEKSIYHQLNRVLRLANSSTVEPWFGFLKLFHTALEKLPTVKTKIWRGMHIDTAKNLRVNQDIIWCGVSSCSLSIDRIKVHLGKSSILCSIDSINGKSIRGYTNYIDEHEVILLPGTRLRVKTNSFDYSFGQHVIHLVETTNNGPGKSASNSCLKPSINKSPENTSDLANPTGTFISKKNITVKTHVLDADESKKSIDSSVTSFHNGTRYEITYKKGDKDGYAKFYDMNGEMYEGCFADIRANGDGFRISSNGDRYDGKFKHNKMEGYGSLSRGNGYTYVGSWINDEACGRGTSTWTNGSHYEGYHEKGKINGYGTFYSTNGDKYEGNLTDGKAQGRGVRIWADGDRYEGDFEDDKKHGLGTYYYKSGGIYKGNWAYDEMNGEGLLRWPSKTQYQGTFKNGKRHGRGKLTFHNGRVQEGRWENDKYMS